MQMSSGSLLAHTAVFVDQEGVEFAAVISKVHNQGDVHDDVNLHVFIESESGLVIKERVPYSDNHAQRYTWHFHQMSRNSILTKTYRI